MLPSTGGERLPSAGLLPQSLWLVLPQHSLPVVATITAQWHPGTWMLVQKQWCEAVAIEQTPHGTTVLVSPLGWCPTCQPQFMLLLKAFDVKLALAQITIMVKAYLPRM